MIIRFSSVFGLAYRFRHFEALFTGIELHSQYYQHGENDEYDKYGQDDSYARFGANAWKILKFRIRLIRPKLSLKVSFGQE